MNNKDWNKTLFKFNFSIIIVVFILEIVNSILMEKNGTLTMDLSYCIKYIFLPTFINLLALFSNVFVRRRYSNNIRIQNNTSILSLAIICCVIACVHFTFHATLTIWIVPICLSMAFLDYGLYLKTLVVSIIGFLVALIHRYNSILGPDDDVNILPDVMVSFCILVVACFLAKINMDMLVLQKNELKNLSEMDQLTGLYNRRKYENALTKLKKENPDSLVIYTFDVNGLKKVNDTMGHKAGDELIKGAARCIEEVFSIYGKCYRTGGDEFSVIISDSQFNHDETISKYNTVVKEWHGEIVPSMTVSVGVAIQDAENRKSIDELVNLADKTMYKDKALFYRNQCIDRRDD